MARLTRLIRRERVKAVFPESSINAKLAQAIARQTGATSDYALYGDTLGPEGLERRHLPDHGARQRRRDGARLHRGSAGMPDRGDLTPRRRPRAWPPATARAPVLSDVSFALHAGERMGVLGPNGGGKTTLFRVLLGELAPVAGTLRGARALRRRAADRALAAGLPGQRARRRAHGLDLDAAVVAAPGPRAAPRGARGARSGRAGRAGRRDLRRPLGRPAPARAGGPGARAGRARDPPRRAVHRPRRAERRAPRGAARRRSPPRGAA